MKRHSDSVALRYASDWLQRASANPTSLSNVLRGIYGHAPDVLAERLQRVARMAEVFVSTFGDAPVVLARAPGRVNVMGRHIDHQGGHCNMLAIEPDVYVMAAEGRPGRLCLRNLDEARFPAADAPLDGLLEGYHGGNWSHYVGSEPVRRRARAASGAWHYYIVAALARLTAEYPGQCVQGLEAVVAGNVPVAAGLSSSSALVVAASEAIATLSGLHVPADRLVTLCSEAEWYVGTRGGAGDQAAMKYARQGEVVQIGFHPLQVGKSARWPDEYVLLVAHSGSEARKSAGARDIFNQRVACYHIGRTMLVRRFPELIDRVHHLRDLTPYSLGVPDAQVFSMMGAVPRTLRREQIADAVGPQLAAELLATHDCRDIPYPVRGVVLFGIAECERSRRCIDLLQAGELETLGRLMQISHDGDRVSSLDGTWCWPEGKPYDDEVLCRLADDCRDGHKLAHEPGAYACSTPDLDAMVDILLSVPGVLGAQVSGAGLGGSMMALVREDSSEQARRALMDRYYAPRGIDPAILECRPVAGCGTIWLP